MSTALYATTVATTVETRLGRSVSIDQAATLLNVSRRTIYNRIREGRVQTIRTFGGSQRVLVESLIDLGFRPQAFPASASQASFEDLQAIRNLPSGLDAARHAAAALRSRIRDCRRPSGRRAVPPGARFR